MTPLAATEAERLEPCPFCGSVNLQTTSYGDHTQYIECRDCGASGPAEDHGNSHIDYWNRRASQQSAAQAAAEPVAYSPNAADWLEDFAQENGNYENRCNRCGIGFMGNKHRRVCRVCAAPDRAPSTEPVLARQVATWRKEVARLQDLISTAEGAPSTVTPWQDRMAAHYAQGKSVQCHPEAHFMRQEIEDWRCTPSTDSAADACVWHLADEDNGIWESSCGEAWSFIDGGPKENRVSFCHHCGKRAAIAASMPQKEDGPPYERRRFEG